MPQPMDVNTELGRVAAAERITLIADRASLAAQARVADEAVAKRQHVETEVRETEQKDKEVDSEARRREPFSGRRRRKEKGSEEEKRHASAPDAKSLPVISGEDHEHGLDISI